MLQWVSYCNSNFHLIRSKILRTNDFELNLSSLYIYMQPTEIYKQLCAYMCVWIRFPLWFYDQVLLYETVPGNIKLIFL